MDHALKQYGLITANYWAFTLSDGAMRMLVLLYFYQQGFDAFAIASVFVLYELCGVLTNGIGGWLAARIGLNHTMNLGLALQILALMGLWWQQDQLSVWLVTALQGLSGIAKDLNKMSAKTGIKYLTQGDQQTFRWVAALTGSKNTLKGIGYFLGAAGLQAFGFASCVLIQIIVLGIALILSLIYLQSDFGKASVKPKFSAIFSNSATINRLAFSRIFLFGGRDIWFAIALPVFVASELGWSHSQTGALMAAWIVGYGVIQASAPKLMGKAPLPWHWLLVLAPLLLLGLLSLQLSAATLIAGLGSFGILFALNSAHHSYLIVKAARDDGASMDVGFYYMANAIGRLLGTLASGALLLNYGIEGVLLASAVAMAVAALSLPRGANI